MSQRGFEAFLRWVLDEELAGRPDRRRTARDLATAVLRVVDGAGDLTGRTVLDLGSGTGAVAAAALDRGALEVVALDVDGEALRRGRVRYRGAGRAPWAVQGHAEVLPFREASFDASLHRGVLVALEDPRAAVAGERRALRPGGRVSCSVTLGAEVDLAAADPGLERVWRQLGEAMRAARSSALTEGGLVDLYQNAGFERVRVERWDRGIDLEDGDAVARAFVASPAVGASAREAWERAGIPGSFLDEFLARLVREGDRGSPARLVAPEAFLTALR